jgi:hypothetical protein
MDFLRDLLPTAPSFGPFTDVVGPWVTLFLGVVWAAAIVFAVVKLVIGMGKFASARRNYRGEEMSEASRDVLIPLVTLVGLMLVFAVFWVVASFAGS